MQRARDDAEAKFQRAMEQLIAAQTSHKKAVSGYLQLGFASMEDMSQMLIKKVTKDPRDHHSEK